MELLKQVNRVHHDGRPDLFELGTKYSAAELEKRLTDTASENPIFVAVSAYEPSQVYGHCFCERRDYRDNPLFTDITSLYIDDVCVDEKARGLGVGRTLLEFVRDWAREKGYYNITLGVWELNAGARAFYESLGMKPQETIMESIL